MPTPQYFQRAKKTRIYYDPLGNVVKTINPDNSIQATLRGKQENITDPQLHQYELNEPESFKPSPWESFTYDANDLAPITHEGQLTAQTGVSTTHYFTPKSATVDPLGRTVKTTEHKATATAEDVVMQYEYDIRGNLKKVTDAHGRTAFSHVYDLRPKQKNDKGEEQPLTPTWTYHIDKGISKVLADALGKPIETIDAKGAQVISAFDTLSRPIKIWAKDMASETVTLRQLLIYGDSAGLINPENNNLKGKLYKHYDEAGVTVFNQYDFKGNGIEKTRQVITDEEILTVFDSPPPDWQISCYRVNWLPPPATDFDDYADSILDATVYQTDTEYDALNRVTKLIYPEDLDTERKELLPVYNKAGALEKVSLDGDNYVEHIAYNAKGQRLLIAFGNGVMSRYCYDANTFRLARLKSEKYTFTKVAKIHTYTSNSGTRQDYGYKYDLAGNIIKITDKTPDSGVTTNPDELIRNFTYDPLYRLLLATGRECNTPATNPWDDISKCTDINDRRLYTQKYSYDKMGNMLTLQNIATSNTYTREFNYTTDNNYLNSIDIGVNNYSFTYDENGNQITENSSRKFEWDYSDKLRCFYNQAGASEPSVYEHYLYDGQGNRTKKLTRKSGGNIEVSIYIDGILDHQYYKNSTGTITAENNTLHIMDDKSRIANLRVGTAFSGDTTPEIQYNLEDHLGSSNIRIDENGTVIDCDEFYPFGETSLHTFDKKRYRFVGKERDEYSGMYYYGARYYAAWTCRFVSVDPLREKYPWYTPYQYAGNKPIIAIDIDGTEDRIVTEKWSGGILLFSRAEIINDKPTNNQIKVLFRTESYQTGAKNVSDLSGNPIFVREEVKIREFYEFTHMPMAESKAEPDKFSSLPEVNVVNLPIKPEGGSGYTQTSQTPKINLGDTLSFNDGLGFYIPSKSGEFGGTLSDHTKSAQPGELESEIKSWLNNVAKSISSNPDITNVTVSIVASIGTAASSAEYNYANSVSIDRAVNNMITVLQSQIPSGVTINRNTQLIRTDQVPAPGGTTISVK
ncbi:MAG: RHS repeat domain-containing protein [Bacteroidia bacterium]